MLLAEADDDHNRTCTNRDTMILYIRIVDAYVREVYYMGFFIDEEAGSPYIVGLFYDL